MSKSHVLPAENVHYMWDATIPPVLEIDPGDEVMFESRCSTEDQVLPGQEGPNEIDLSRVHPLTGPIFVRGAQPGDTLEISIKMLRSGGWGVSYTENRYTVLSGEFPEPYYKFFDQTRPEGIEFEPGITLPHRPVLGVMGVARPDVVKTTIEPGDFGGNMDCKEMTVGARVFLPVLVEGALFSVGDAHGCQGDGELCVPIETAMTGLLQFFVHDDRPVEGPQVETKDAYMTIGHGETMEEASREAVGRMVSFLVRHKGMERYAAYVLCSCVGDLRVNAVVTKYVGMRLELPKGIFADDTLIPAR